MSGRLLLTLPRTRRTPNERLAACTPWFGVAGGQPEVGGAPWLGSLEGLEFIDDFFAGVAASPKGLNLSAWPELKRWRDWSPPPASMLDASGHPRYPVSRHVPQFQRLDEAAPLQNHDADGVPSGTPDWLRKLYLPFHQHFHVVAAEFVCEHHKLPAVSEERLLEAGFIVRRLIPDAKEERWEDWVPAPSNQQGVWVELADRHMRVLEDTSTLLDPTRLSSSLTPKHRDALFARLGLSPEQALPAALSFTPMTSLPPEALEAAERPHCVRWALLPVSSRQTQLPRPPAASVAQALKLRQERRRAALSAGLAASTSLGQAVFEQTRALLEPFWPEAPPPVQQAQEALRDALATRLVDVRRAQDPSYNKTMEQLRPEALQAIQARLDHQAPLIWFEIWSNAAQRFDHDTWLSWWQDVTQPQVEGRPDALTSQADLELDPLFGDPNVANLYRTLLADTLWVHKNAFLMNASLLGTQPDVVRVWEALVGAGLRLVRSARRVLMRHVTTHLGTAPNAFLTPAEIADAHAALDAFDPEAQAPLHSAGSWGEELHGWMEVERLRGEAPPAWTPITWPAREQTLHEKARALETTLEAFAEAFGAAADALPWLYQERRHALLARHANLGTGEVLGALSGAGVRLDRPLERGALLWPSAFWAPDALWAALSEFDLQEDGGEATSRAQAQAPLPRFDDRSLYAVWCFARIAPQDPCREHPALVWSARTDVFSLAEPLDVLGLKPAPFSLPDLPKMLRDIPRIPLARASPFAPVTTPANSGVSVGSELKDASRSWGIAWVCSFGIPVFTLCAWIMFSFIFSILIALPGFMWMLMLKFCLPVPKPEA